MKKAFFALIVVGAALAGAASSASAQSVYFGFGTGGGGYYPRDHYYGGYGGNYYRPYYRPSYRPYPAYGYSDCYYRTIRRYNDYRGVWVVRRVRVCD